ncbi:MAG TPA: hypothetical protein VK988_02330 [Acidimicrobiales bacterium]|nr:hypothetical protein [Acidimicrobiales bacterium]
MRPAISATPTEAGHVRLHQAVLEVGDRHGLDRGDEPPLKPDLPQRFLDVADGAFDSRESRLGPHVEAHAHAVSPDAHGRGELLEGRDQVVHDSLGVLVRARTDRVDADAPLVRVHAHRAVPFGGGHGQINPARLSWRGGCGWSGRLRWYQRQRSPEWRGPGG